MIASNFNWLVCGAAVGLAIALAITVPAHQDNPFLAAPGIFFGLVVAAVGTIVSLSLIMFFRKRGRAVVALCGCFVMMLAVLALLPFAWPYPKAEGPRPFAHDTHDQWGYDHSIYVSDVPLRQFTGKARDVEMGLD